MSDEEYNQLLARIVKGALYLGNPLITPSDRARGLKLYDSLCEKALRYKGVIK